MRLLALTTVLLHLAAIAKGQNLVVFGDSLTDSGFGARRISQTLRTTSVYPSPPYWQGRFSDGPTWVEAVASFLGISLINYACAGASSGATPAGNNPLLPPFGGLTQPYFYQAPNFGQQVDLYLRSNGGAARSGDVHIVEFGNNDLLLILRGYNATVEDVVAATLSGIEDLYEAGARRFILTANSRIFSPSFSTVELLNVTQIYSAAHFLAIANLAAALPSMLPNTTARVFNFGSALLEIYGNATQLGITNTTACYLPVLTSLNGLVFNNEANRTGTICSDPLKHTLFDNLHPSSSIHAGVARAFMRDLAPGFWTAAPEARLLSSGSSIPNAALAPEAAVSG